MTQRSRVGIFIRELRISKGLSQADLGNKLHVTKKAVSRWETGRGLPDSSMLLPLSEMLGVTVDEILKGEFTISTEYDDFEKRRIEEINSFLKYCCEKKHMIKMLDIHAKRLGGDGVDDVKIHTEASGFWSLWILWTRSVYGTATVIKTKK